MGRGVDCGSTTRSACTSRRSPWRSFTCHPHGHRAAHLQPLPVDADLLDAFFIYPLNGTHHYIFSSIPMAAQTGAIVASVYLGMDVVLNVSNLLLSLKGSAGVVARDVPLRFVWGEHRRVPGREPAGLAANADARQPLRPLYGLGHRSRPLLDDRLRLVRGHRRVAARLGADDRPALQRPRRQLGLLAAGGRAVPDGDGPDGGGAGAGTALAVRVRPGSSQSYASQPYWISRSLTALPILAGFGALLSGHADRPCRPGGPGPRLAGTSADAEALASEQVFQEIAGSHRRALPWLTSACVPTGVAGLGCFLFSFVVLAVWPNQTLEHEIAASRPPGLPRLSERELRGRADLRPRGLPQLPLPARPGHRRRRAPLRPAEPGVGDGERIPAALGHAPHRSRPRPRVRQRSRHWHLTHLWNPRWVVPESKMPAHPWLFDGSPLDRLISARPGRLLGLPRPGRTPGRHAGNSLARKWTRPRRSAWASSVTAPSPHRGAGGAPLDGPAVRRTGAL